MWDNLVSRLAKKKFLVLDAGSSDGNCKEMFGKLGIKCDVERLDIDPNTKPDILHDLRKPLPEQCVGRYDLVYCSHVLEHIEREQVANVAKYLVDGIKVGGQLIVAVPSLEWACKKVVMELDDIFVQLVLYGDQSVEFQYHKCAFTVSSLKKLIDMTGLEVQKVWQEWFNIVWLGKTMPALQNVCLAVRRG
jgi:2-polyprenyl-3-methyl-5-hydroxy-6-metoxy-1,4-benzoquinol methylase